MKINDENCKVVPGFSRYVISESGRIYRVKPINKKEKDLAKKEKDKLYFKESKVQFYDNRLRGRWTQVGLVNDSGKFSTAAVEKLLCQAYGLLSGIKSKERYAVEFIDGNHRNMSINNLRPILLGPNNSKLSKDDVKLIKKKIAKGIPLRHIAKEYGVSDMQIGRIKTGENWRKGGRKVPPPEAPFEVEDGRMRRLLASFEYSAIDNTIRRPFTLKRDDEDPKNNKIVGAFNGYRFSKPNSNVTRSYALIYKLNKFFFSEEIAEKMSKKLRQKGDDSDMMVL